LLPNNLKVKSGVRISEKKYQLSLTNQRDALHHGKRAVNTAGGR